MKTRHVDDLTTHLVACADGDQAAFAALYDAVAPRVHGLVLRVLRDHHQSEEVSQEVLLEVWESASRFDPARGSALSWVLTMAHRRAVDRVRTSESARRRDLAAAESSWERPFDETAVAVHASFEAVRVREALATLTPAQREAIELAYFGGHTYGEVSQLTEVPLGTTKSRIRDGLHRLRQMLVLPVVEAGQA